MATLIGRTQPDGRIKVGAIWYQRDDPSRGTVVDRAVLPSFPASKRGVRHELYYDPVAGTFAFEETARPLTDEEQRAEDIETLQSQVADLESRITTLEGRP